MILFTHEGGVDIGDVDAKAAKLTVPVDGDLPTRADLKAGLLAAVPAHRQDALVDFLARLYSAYVELHYTYLEINPLVCTEAADGSPSIAFLDMAAKLDQTADYLCGAKWAIARDTSGPVSNGDVGAKVFADRGPPMVFPAPFGRDLTKEEAYIQKLDASTGASLKLTVLNAEGRVWTMVAGGGASVVYSFVSLTFFFPAHPRCLQIGSCNLATPLLRMASPTNWPITVNTLVLPPRIKPLSTPRLSWTS